MPLASTAALQWYGPAAAAMVVDGAEGVVESALPMRFVRGGATVTGLGDAPLLRPFRGRQAAASILGEGEVLDALPTKFMRVGMTVSVNQLSQDDVTGAVLEAPIEGGLTLRQVMRLLLAYTAGDATGLDGNPAFKSQDGSKTRVSGTVSGGNRTVTTVDGT